jgi:hypothetical protein
MQKVEGSSPSSALEKPAGNGGFFYGPAGNLAAVGGLGLAQISAGL